MDGTGNERDTSAGKQDSSESGKGTSTETTETFTKQMVDKAVSDALSKAGREAKSLTEQQKKLDTGLADLTAKQIAWQKKQDEVEEEAVADDMPALTALRDRRAKKVAEESKVTELADRESKLVKRETELAEIVERDRILKRTELASEIAVKKGVSMSSILDFAKEDTREEYERVAAKLPPAKELPVILSDSGRTNKGGSASIRGRDKMLAGLASLHPEGK